MKNASQNYLIDLLGFVSFLFLTSTGIIMHYLLPAGSGHDLGILGLSRHDWGAIHFWTSVVFFGVIALHLVWHWTWIVNMVKRRRNQRFNWRAALGIVGIISIIFLSIGPLLIKPTFQQGTEITTEQSIQGSMSIRQIHEATGVPVNHLIKKLDLPADVDVQTPLRLIKDEHGFDMGRVRSVVADWKEDSSN